MHLVPMGQVPDQSQPRRQRLVIGVRAVEEDSGHLAHILCSLFAHGSYQSQLANRFTAILGAEQMLWRNAVLNAAFAYDRPPPSGCDIDSRPDPGCLHRVPSALKASTTRRTHPTG